jgi:hypothetical protein
LFTLRVSDDGMVLWLHSRNFQRFGLCGQSPNCRIWVERLSAARQRTALPNAIMITGTDDHDPPECMITIHRIG